MLLLLQIVIFYSDPVGVMALLLLLWPTLLLYCNGGLYIPCYGWCCCMSESADVVVRVDFAVVMVDSIPCYGLCCCMSDSAVVAMADFAVVL